MFHQDQRLNRIFRRVFRKDISPNLNKPEEHGLESSKQLYQYKTVLLGESAVGKSCLAVRFVKEFFNPYEESTVGAAFLSKTLYFPKFNVKLDIWDTAGAENYHVIAPLYYKRANAVILVYDITNRESFEKIHYWIRELRMANSVTTVALVGNKSDMDVERSVEYEEGLDLAKSWGYLFFETSAKTGCSVDVVFDNLARKLTMYKENFEDEDTEKEHLKISQGCCCCKLF
nr:ras-related protein Rab-5A-like isoform X1 [Onthophagus taurus]